MPPLTPRPPRLPAPPPPALHLHLPTLPLPPAQPSPHPPPGAHPWNVDAFVDAIASRAPSLDWASVVTDHLGRPDLDAAPAGGSR